MIAPLFSSCTDYLDKSPDSDVDPQTAFKNFTNFQGYVEQVYNCIPNKESNMWCCTFNWGEDEIMNTGLGDTHVTHHFDLGDYRYWYQNNQSFLHADNPDPTSEDKYAHSLEHSWWAIRKMNLGLVNLDLLVDATQEEKNFIKGQLLFFRAWWHFEMIQWYGGLPYVDEALPAAGEYKLPRLSFQECAERCAEDFRAAADLLPNNWDNTTVGKRTLGKNDLRITKVCALGYLGKALLWAASPMNSQGTQTGALKSGVTYKYDTQLATRAADALAEAIAEVAKPGNTPYKLADFEYDAVSNYQEERGIYDHISSTSKNTYSNIFYTTGQGWMQPGGTEAILRGPQPNENGSNWNFTKLWGPKVNDLVQHDAVIHMPTANYINYAYGMANGEPAYIVKDGKLVINEESGFDPTHPFKDRDPRFYHDIIFDGFRYINADPGDDGRFQYCEMFTGGNLRDDANGSRTGYYCQKLVPHQANKYDGMYNWGGALQTYLPYMRLADIYLMYAEACAAVGGASYKSTKCTLSAVQAIEVLRERVGAGKVATAYCADPHKFMDEVRRERACELAFEGFRWNDLQRWLLLTEAPFNIKTSQEFTRVGDYDFKKKDPAEAQVTGWKEEVILERVYTTKHYLLPLKNSDIYLYSEYPQNPGW